ncbi:DUF2399 domain-containing protein [Amycolatopsis sp. NPDC005232]|uniref:DUF2399 domain-containing protein n=1 Tax=Amycolatopsis sp. NPDC005232 TaxID=3157027 RepID=UPI0033AEB5F8
MEPLRQLVGGTPLVRRPGLDLRKPRCRHDRLPIRPWRFDAAAYHSAAAAHPGTTLTGTPTIATWDADPAPAMAELATKVEEERVLDTLAEDLETP